MSERICFLCKTLLPTRLNEWGDDYARPLCYSCWSKLIAEMDETQAFYLKDCPSCHQHTLYDKAEVGYPGLYHCASCGAWLDLVNHQAWTYHPTFGQRLRAWLNTLMKAKEAR